MDTFSYWTSLCWTSGLSDSEFETARTRLGFRFWPGGPEWPVAMQAGDGVKVAFGSKEGWGLFSKQWRETKGPKTLNTGDDLGRFFELLLASSEGEPYCEQTSLEVMRNDLGISSPGAIVWVIDWDKALRLAVGVEKKRKDEEGIAKAMGAAVAAVPPHSRTAPKGNPETQDRYNEERSALIVACKGRGSGRTKKQWIADTKTNPGTLSADARRAWDRLTKGASWNPDKDGIPIWWSNMEAAERAPKARADKKESKAATAQRKTTRSKP